MNSVVAVNLHATRRLPEVFRESARSVYSVACFFLALQGIPGNAARLNAADTVVLGVRVVRNRLETGMNGRRKRDGNGKTLET